MDVFIQYHDGLVDQKKAIPDDENRRGILSKAKGQCARLSMIQYVLSQAVEIAVTSIKNSSMAQKTFLPSVQLGAQK